MIFIALGCLALVILGAGWFIYRRNTELFLCFLIALSCDLFYLLPRLHGPEDYRLLLLPIMAVLLLDGMRRGEVVIGRYGWWIISFTGISLFGVLVAWFSGQNVLLGLKAAKFIPLVLVYFLITGRRIDSEKFTNYFILMGLAVACLAMVTAATHGAVNLFPGMPRDMLTEQLGRHRLNAGQFVISAAAVVAFARYAQSSRIRFLSASALLFAEVLLVQQTRGFIVAVALSIFVVYVLSHRLTALRISLYLLFSGFCLCSWLLLNIDLSSVAVVKRTRQDLVRRGGSYGNSYQARLNAYNHYWKELQKQPVTGLGMLNFNWDGNTEKRLQVYRGIHLSDIGVVHFLVQAGLVGFLWLMYGLMKIWKDILFFRKHLSVACYFIIGTFTLPTLDMFLRKDSLFLFAVFLGLSSSIIMAARRAAASTAEA